MGAHYGLSPNKFELQSVLSFYYYYLLCTVFDWFRLWKSTERMPCEPGFRQLGASIYLLRTEDLRGAAHPQRICRRQQLFRRSSPKDWSEEKRCKIDWPKFFPTSCRDSTSGRQIIGVFAPVVYDSRIVGFLASIGEYTYRREYEAVLLHSRRSRPIISSG